MKSVVQTQQFEELSRQKRSNQTRNKVVCWTNSGRCEVYRKVTMANIKSHNGQPGSVSTEITS